MSEYDPEKPIKDFVGRTVKLACRNKKDEYNVTLQINLLLGTVVVTKANWYKKFNSESIGVNSIVGVIIYYKKESIPIKVLLHCLRNGVAHWRENENNNIEFDMDSNDDIGFVTIKGSGRVNDSCESVSVKFDIKNDGLINFMKYVNSILT